MAFESTQKQTRFSSELGKIWWRLASLGQTY